MPRSVNLREIYPHGGDHRSAFEELSCLLFAREFATVGAPIRRHGAGGDRGLESTIVDSEGRPLIGIQAKFYKDKLDSTQWRDLHESICTALDDKSNRQTLQKIVVVLPRNLTPTQSAKWTVLVSQWGDKAKSNLFSAVPDFELWDEDRVRNLLLQSKNRGILLHYFEHPDFDRERCIAKATIAIQQLGVRYQPLLHTPTEAEDMLHCFLRSERFRQQFLEEARTQLGGGIECREASAEWSDCIKANHQRVTIALEQVKSHLSDGVTLPDSLNRLATSLEEANAELRNLLPHLFELIPKREPTTHEEHWRYNYTRHPTEQVYESFAEKARQLHDLAGFLRNNSAADLQAMLLYGDPGRGKTHVLAEVCSRYMQQGGVVLFFEGASFFTSAIPWDQILRRVDFPGTSVQDFLLTIEALAERSGLKALICIDALNETADRNYWKQFLLGFSEELKAFPGIKLVVSCRSDYMRQTMPEVLANRSSHDWAFAEHTGLGISVLEAMPKYMKAYGVTGFALPPLTSEFKSPLFLRIFCEAYQGRCPDIGTLSLAVILKEYARRKAMQIAERIDCHLSTVEATLVELGAAIMGDKNRVVSYLKAMSICRSHHSSNEASKSLYSALISECILFETPSGGDGLFESNVNIRFTYERIWDYFLSRHLFPTGSSPTPEFLEKLCDDDFLTSYPGVVSMLAVRLAEELKVEIFDLKFTGKKQTWPLSEAFLKSISWRTKESLTKRTMILIGSLIDNHVIRDEVELFVSFSINSAHPLNADWLHSKLMAMRLSRRDREWTFWLNEKLMGWSQSPSLAEIRSWAEHAKLELVPDNQIRLLGTVLAWCLTTTAVGQRNKITLMLCRVLAGRSEVAAQLFAQFAEVDDSYISETILLACLGAAQHAGEGDAGLRKLARLVQQRFFSKSEVEPHLLIRHYASAICIQAEKKNSLPEGVDRQSYRPPWKSKWPRIWTAEKIAHIGAGEQKQIRWLYQSVEPEGKNVHYGDFGRYVMQSCVRQFANRKIGQIAVGSISQFDAQIARRFVIQRVFKLGWDPAKIDVHPEGAGSGRDNERVERLSKKYQWIALYEFLGYLSDHYQFISWDQKPREFTSAQQLNPRHLMDPYSIERKTNSPDPTWCFVKEPAPWWRGGLDPLPRPMSPDEQRFFARRLESDNPRKMIELSDGIRPWLALSFYHHIHEPEPLWETQFLKSRVGVEWAAQSYLVRPENFDQLVARLSLRHVGSGQLWFHEPGLGQSLSVLKTYPDSQERLDSRCNLNNWRETSEWQTDAVSTSCQCNGTGEQVIGSIPSPLLARIGSLKWQGQALNFVDKDHLEAMTSYFGPDYRGTLVVRRDALVRWLRESGYHIVWRCHYFKYRPLEHDECNARDYWMTYTLDANGDLKLCKGATSACSPDSNDEESLPWS